MARRPESTVESILADLMERVTALERKRTVRIGAWRIEERDGLLVAVNTDTGVTYTLAP